MIKFIFYRLLQAIPVLWLVITVTFFLVHAVPGGPFDSERRISAEILANLNASYNLDAPLYQQYFTYLNNLLHGDFGPSFKYPGHTVTELISSGFPTTLELGLYALLVALILGISTGIIAALRANSWGDYLPMSIAMIGICLPSFLLGPLLILLFGFYLPWLPVAGWNVNAGDKILPALTLGTAYAAYISRMTRGSMLEILSQDFIRTAHAKGLPMYAIIYKHALRGGLATVVTFLGPAFAGLLSGSFVVETLFQIPGLGRFYVQSAFNRDYTMIMGCTIFLATLIIIFNLLSDICAAWLNPKLRQ